MSEKVTHVTDAEFEREVLQSERPVLVDFWAPWCGPCRTIAPVLEDLAGDYGERLRIVKLNVDDNPKTASELGVRGIPTLVLYSGGQEVERIVGASPKPVLQERIDRALGAQVG